MFATAAPTARVTAPVQDPVIAAAGDIACDSSDPSFNGGEGTVSECRQKHSAALLQGVSAVLPLGDLQYEHGEHSKFFSSYEPTWGAYKAITHPVPGNHEYESPGATGYFDYFGPIAGDRAKGYYSFDLGSWHLIALNSECEYVGGCAEGSPQEQWLRADLAATMQPCILAYWHKPRFSSGGHGSDRDYHAFFTALYGAHADVVLTAHDHAYERFALQGPERAADPLGIRAFVVGTGGRNLKPFVTVKPNSEVRNSDTFGVLKVALHRGSYDWQFVPIAGQAFTDSGTTECHRGPAIVALAEFRATRGRAGVTVRWQTAEEKRTVAFNLYRERGVRLVRLNRVPIKAAGGQTRRSYRWLDRQAGRRAARYRLEALDIAGGRSWVVGRATVKAARKPSSSGSGPRVPAAVASADPVVAAAGDIACDPRSPNFNDGDGTATRCRQRYTAALLRGATAVLPLGDLQYEDGVHSKFLQSYERSWGAYKATTYPVPGNHEYQSSPAADGYFDYFGARAGQPGRGYYSFDLGSWHLVALNSECDHIGGCAEGSPQERWLRADLARTTKPCILAYWHRPRFSSGRHGNDDSYAPFWRALYGARADVVLNGHDHDYERFDPQTPDGEADPQGPRAFVAGTGGRSLRPFRKLRPNSAVQNSSTFGVLKLTLRRGSYAWTFSAERTADIVDAGSGQCHRGPVVVRLASLRAARARVGVTIVWRTAAERRLAGFNLYRERGGRRVRLNRSLIKGGRRGYAWRDSRASSSALRYRLEAVDLGGGRTWVGSVPVNAR